MGRVIHTGQALVDTVVEIPALPRRGGNVMASSVHDYAGGAVNILVAAARAGAECVHAGAHGTGPRGDLIRDVLASEQVTLSAPPIADADTGICFVMVEPSAERTFVTTLGAERQITSASLQASRPEPGDLVCITGYSFVLPQTCAPLLHWIASLPTGAILVLDPGAAFADLPDAIRGPVLARTDVFTGNAEESSDLADVDGMEASARVISKLLRPRGVAIVRDGPKGCCVRVAGRTITVPGFPQKPLDTNGAGDCHTGVLVAERARGASWAEAARRANAAAAIKVTRRGPGTAPTRSEVDAFLASQN